MYFGLGCRNVSKVFLPRNFDINYLQSSFENYQIDTSSKQYLDNYNYQKTILQINGMDFIDFKNLLFVKSNQMHSPISVLYYDYYDDINILKEEINTYRNQIQCIVSQDSGIVDSVPFGFSQKPEFNDFPDGIDVMQFLLSN